MAAIYGLQNETYYQVFPTLEEALESPHANGREELVAEMYENDQVLLAHQHSGYCFAKIDDLTDVHVNANFPTFQNRLNYLMGTKSKSERTKKQMSTAL